MRALILSDTHGDETNLRWLLEQVWKQTGPIDYYLHLGDGALDFEHQERFIRERDPNATCIGVRGNCDFFGNGLQEMLMPVIGGVHVFMTHGHRYGVKNEYSMIDYASKERGCTVTLFGHTHQQYMEQRDTLLINPGAARDGYCAVLNVDAMQRVNVKLLSF